MFTSGMMMSGGRRSADFGASNTTKLLQRIGDQLGITGTVVTLQCWVKLQTEITSGDYGFIEVVTGNTNFRNFIIRYEYNAGTRRLAFLGVRSGISIFPVYHTITLGISVWTHLAITYDGTNIKGYVNGTLVGTTAFSGGGLSAYTPSFTIGSLWDAPTATPYSFASAIIDDARVWGVDRGATAIGTDYSAPAQLVGNEADLRAYYTFNTSLLTDLTANAYTLTNVGTVTQSTNTPF